MEVSANLITQDRAVLLSEKTFYLVNRPKDRTNHLADDFIIKETDPKVYFL